jgi:hypothetical protein
MSTITGMKFRDSTSRSLLSSLGESIKYASVVDTTDIFLHHSAVLRPQHNVCGNPCNHQQEHSSTKKLARLTFKEGATPTNWVSNAPLSLEHIAHVPDREVVPALRVFGEYVFKPLRHKAPFVVIRPGVTAMLIPVYVLEEDTC